MFNLHFFCVLHYLLRLHTGRFSFCILIKKSFDTNYFHINRFSSFIFFFTFYIRETDITMRFSSTFRLYQTCLQTFQNTTCLDYCGIDIAGDCGTIGNANKAAITKHISESSDQYSFSIFYKNRAPAETTGSYGRNHGKSVRLNDCLPESRAGERYRTGRERCRAHRPEAGLFALRNFAPQYFLNAQP